MINEPPDWYPGSFTKNFSWGKSPGLGRLRDAIQICFDGASDPVPRREAIQRLERKGFIWHIPLNFFLLNQKIGREDFVIFDELAYQATSFDYDVSFDKIALVALHNSYVGTWSGAKPWQSYPASWANNYVRKKVYRGNAWVTSGISANDIEDFIIKSGKYRAKDARKLSTNLNFLYEVARISDFENSQISRWWVDSLFLVLDRSFAETGAELTPETANMLTIQSGFMEMSGSRTKNKDLSILPLSTLYWACGGIDRWSRTAVQERQNALLPDIGWFANSDDPFFAIYKRDPNIIKTLPKVCAMLAKNLADFEELDAEEIINWDPVTYIRRKTREALSIIKERNIKPTMSADELLRITRGE
jgi:hypothetical protein